MPDYHWHANHVDAPARGSKAAARLDARRLAVTSYNLEQPRVPGGIVSYELLRAHGPDFPVLVRCYQKGCY